MADESAENIPDESARVISQLLTELESIKVRAEGTLAAAEESRRKADSESAYAFNAKQNAEDHAKAISQIRGTVEAESTWLATTKANAEDGSQAIKAARAVSDADTQAIAKAKVAAETDANTATAARNDIGNTATEITTTKGNIATAWSQVQSDAANVAQAKATAEASAMTATALQMQVTENTVKIDNDRIVIAGREAESKLLLKSLTTASATANQAQERVTQYESDLTSLKAQFEALRAKTEALLPGATSAGLASSFRDQKARFDGPQRNWLIVFITTMLFLFVAALLGLPGLGSSSSGGNESWDVILRHIVNRLPIVGPLVWLGIYAGRNYIFALRMQEEYAFKEAISATFEGYKREMEAIQPATPEGGVPLVTLCENVLATLAQRPGRIYEGSHEDITPLAPVSKMLKDLAGNASKLVEAGITKAIEEIKKDRP